MLFPYEFAVLRFSTEQICPSVAPSFLARFFIALVVSDYDSTNGVLSVTKARVAGIDRDRTKIARTDASCCVLGPVRCWSVN